MDIKAPATTHLHITTTSLYAVMFAGLGISAWLTGNVWLIIAAIGAGVAFAASLIPSRPKVPACGVVGCRSNVRTHVHPKPKAR